MNDIQDFLIFIIICLLIWKAFTIGKDNHV